MMNDHTKTRLLKRFVPLSVICSSLLLTLLIVRSQQSPYQMELPHALASNGPIMPYDYVAGEEQTQTISAYRRLSYGEMMGMQHERSKEEQAGQAAPGVKEANAEKAGKAPASAKNTGVKAAVSSKHDQHTMSQDTQPAQREMPQGAQYSHNTISQEEPVISVRLSESDELEQVPLEQYVLGVALAELPGSFEPEAIKAQMLAARTYIVYRLVSNGDQAGTTNLLEVTDTTADQVYMSLQQVTEYADAYPEYYQKFVSALQETEGLIISYGEQPIDAVFFSTSNGFTEDAEQLWGQEVAYLQRVASPWDEQYSPSYETEIQFSFPEVYEKLNLKQARRNGMLTITNVVENDSGRIESLKVNGASFTGKELREKLGLASTAVTWKINQKKQEISLLCYGYGHGIGLSQWGAHGMAKKGYSAEDIVKHYYTGVHIDHIGSLISSALLTK